MEHDVLYTRSYATLENGASKQDAARARSLIPRFTARVDPRRRDVARSPERCMKRRTALARLYFRACFCDQVPPLPDASGSDPTEIQS